MKNYIEAVQVLNGKESRKLAYKTLLIRIHDNAIAVRHHSTDIVTYHSDGRTIIRNGNWYSNTTKKRINMYSDANIYQKAWNWYMFDKSQGKHVLYIDGTEV